jgi:thiol:disulfide interchange protein DsbG
LFVRDGEDFQVFYAAPDQEALVAGVMWDATGKNLTKEQVAPLPGVTPTVTIGKEERGGPSQAKSALALAEKTTFGLLGSTNAPRLYVFIDPLCIYSTRALQQLRPFVASGRIQAAIIPLSVLDYEDEGHSTPAALAMLSKAADQMVEAWSRGDLKGAAAPGAETKLRDNMAAAEAIGLRGTPTLVWRKLDGSEGRVDGLPEDWNVVISTMGGERHAER